MDQSTTQHLRTRQMYKNAVLDSQLKFAFEMHESGPDPDEFAAVCNFGRYSCEVIGTRSLFFVTAINNGGEPWNTVSINWTPKDHGRSWKSFTAVPRPKQHLVEAFVQHLLEALKETNHATSK